MHDEQRTRETILFAALELFLQRGIKKTSVEDVARRAGVTRVTVYRYFADKEALVRAAVLRIEQVFQDANRDLVANPELSEASVMEQIGRELGRLPPGDLLGFQNDLKRLYPESYAIWQQVRVAGLTKLFDRLFLRMERDGSLRPGINRQLAQAVFWALVVNAFDNPDLLALGFSNEGLFRALSDILLHGLVRERPNT